MEIKEMSKKEFKNYVNKNGFFLNFKVDRLDENQLKDLETNAKVMSQLPENRENILIFSGIASQNYAKGEKNRNGYKIDQKGRVLDNYKKNPIILLQHNHEYGGIGRSVKLWFDAEGNLINTFYVDLNTLDEKTRYQVENGYITAVSTSHITMEDMIEDNKTGERMTREEAMSEKVDLWGVVFGNSTTHTLVVTKAEMIENSLVTIGSNESAIVSHNSIWNYFINKFLMTNTTITPEIKELIMKENLPDEIKMKVEKLEVIQNDVDADEEEIEEMEEAVSEEKIEEKIVENSVEEAVEEVVDEVVEEVKEDDTTSENEETIETSENVVSQVKEVIKEAENAFNDKVQSQFDLQTNKVKELELSLNKVSQENETLTEWLTVALQEIKALKDNLRSIVVNGVSTFTAKDNDDQIVKEKRMNKLTSMLNNIKRGM